MAQIEIKKRIENEIQTRNRIIKNHLKDRDNVIVLKIDTHMKDEVSPFGFHFELDKKKLEEKRKAAKREKLFKWLSWIAYYHHKFGIRHLLLVLLLVAYVFAGGGIFLALEAPHEMKDLTDTIMRMNRIFSEEANDVINITLTYTGDIRDTKLKRTLKAYYKDLLDAEGRFHGSVWHKAENLDMNLMWYYSSSTFYCMTLFTTIGYGTIAPQTVIGRFISIIYASIGIPLMLVVLGDIGEGFQNVLIKIYIFFLLKYKKLRKQQPPEDMEDIVLPIWLALMIVALYLGACTLFIYLFDHNEGKMPGIDAASAFYFTFISLTTIGLGDVMPYNIQYSPVLASVFLLGLALISIVNTSIYAQCYDGFFNFMEMMENKLEVIFQATHKPHGHKVFQDLEPCILLLVCSFPHLGNEMRAGALESILKPASQMNGDGPKTGGTGKKVTYSAVVRKRTISYSGEQPDAAEKVKTPGRMRAPTLGALGGRDLAKFRKQRQDKNARRNSDASKNAPAVKETAPIPRKGSDAATSPTSLLKLEDWKKMFKKDQKTEDKQEKERKISGTGEPATGAVVAGTTEEKEAKKDPLDLSDLYAEPPISQEQLIVITQDETEPSSGPSENAEPQEPEEPGSDEEEDEELPPEERPAPLISLPIPGQSDEDEDDDDDDDDDDDFIPNPKFAALAKGKRTSVFVPRGQLDDTEDDDGPGPSVEYIP